MSWFKKNQDRVVGITTPSNGKSVSSQLAAGHGHLFEIEPAALDLTRMGLIPAIHWYFYPKENRLTFWGGQYRYPQLRSQIARHLKEKYDIDQISEYHNLLDETPPEDSENIKQPQEAQATNWYKTASSVRELQNWGAKVEGSDVILYRGSNIPNLTQEDLRYGDYLSSVPSGSDITGNAGADDYGKYVVKYKLPAKYVKVTNGEFQYMGPSKSLQGGRKYPPQVYKAYNSYYGSNYTAQEIDKMDPDEVRAVASMGLPEGKEEYDALMKNFKPSIM